MQTNIITRTQHVQTNDWNPAPAKGKKKSYQVISVVFKWFSAVVNYIAFKARGTNTDCGLEFWNGPELKKTLLKLDKNDAQIIEILTETKKTKELQSQVRFIKKPTFSNFAVVGIRVAAIASYEERAYGVRD